jgi:hypothetical protein
VTISAQRRSGGLFHREELIFNKRVASDQHFQIIFVRSKKGDLWIFQKLLQIAILWSCWIKPLEEFDFGDGKISGSYICSQNK